MGTPVRRSSRGRISWSRTKRTPLVTSQVSDHDPQGREDRAGRDGHVAGAHARVGYQVGDAPNVVERGVRHREHHDADRPEEQQDDQMQHAQDRGGALAHAEEAPPQERHGEQTGERLIEHPYQHGDGQPVRRGNDDQREQRARDTRVAERASRRRWRPTSAAPSGPIGAAVRQARRASAARGPPDANRATAPRRTQDLDERSAPERARGPTPRRSGTR